MLYLAKDIMSRDVATIKRDTRVKDVIKMLVEHKITGVPVVDSDMYLVGMVTEKDVLKMLYEGQGQRASIEDLMTTDIVCFDEVDDLMSVFESLVENNFRRVPVLSDGRLTGIISRRDIIRFLFERSSATSKEHG